MKQHGSSLKRLVSYLDDYLAIASIKEDALNGLQVEGSARVARAALAVDACKMSISSTARARANLLIVHHGLFWGASERITGVLRERMALLLKNRISLYSVHIPLDCHEEVGNNVQLARLLDLEPCEKFASYRGVQIGVIAESNRDLSRSTLLGKLESKLGQRAVMLPFGGEKVGRVAIVSGGAASFVSEAAYKGCNTFVTGESSHQAYHVAKEARINTIFAGHYATETVGLKALSAHIEKTFGLSCMFIDLPTGF